MPNIKEKVEIALQEVRKEDELFDFKIFESNDFLIIPETSNSEGESGGSGNSYTVNGGGGIGYGEGGGKDFGEGGDGEGEGGKEHKPEIEKEGKDSGDSDGDDDDGDDDDGDDDDGDDDDGDDDDEQKIKVGDKVRVKSTGKEGVISVVNPDGTYDVSELPTTPQLSKGGIAMFSDGGAVGTYAEEELEVISSSKGGKGKGKGKGKGGEGGESEGGESEGGESEGQQRPQQPPDIEELKARFRKIRAKKFKLPIMAKTLFNADLFNDLFYHEQARLAILNRGAKEVLNYKNPLPADEGKVYFSLDYYSHVEFLRTNVVSFGSAYLIDPTTKIIVYNAKIERIELPSLNDIEDFLENNPTLTSISASLITFKFIEKYQQMDDYYYRILSLTCILKPEFFTQNYLKAHIDFICQYYRIRGFGIANDVFFGFNSAELTEERIFERIGSELILRNLIVYNIIANNEDYIVYKCKNIRVKLGSLDKLEISKMNLSEITPLARTSIMFNLANFYQMSVNLQKNEQLKNTTLRNIEKLSILQKESYVTYITDIKLLLTRY